MRRLLFISSLVMMAFTLHAQTPQQNLVDKEITVGMTVKILPCTKGKSVIESMDSYRKTRIPPAGEAIIDSATGEGMFESFFAPGDFDAKRLTCDYSNKKYKVAALRVFEDEKTKQDKRVMILYTKDPWTVIWVEFDKALELKEIEF
jgi:hypothetical protein